MALFVCKMCSAPLGEIRPGGVCKCSYCGLSQVVPGVQNERSSSLFKTANELRKECEFDKAEALYQVLAAEEPNEPETHWGILLCRYGVEYVKDPYSDGRVPTCHRTEMKSIFSDSEYKKCLSCASFEQRKQYEKEATVIDSLQKKILETMGKDDPVDVFISYKEEDPKTGKQTRDYLRAYKLYNYLIEEGFRVFFAKISLSKYAGSEYEPHIYAGLHSAKVFLLVGSKPEYMNAPWVKNEWGRYLQMTRQDHSKRLIPCLCDMKADELPEELRALQVLDMDRIDFEVELVRGLNSILDRTAKKEAPKEEKTFGKYVGEAVDKTLHAAKEAFVNAVKDNGKKKTKETPKEDPQAQRVYDSAYRALKAKQYLQAVKEFSSIPDFKDAKLKTRNAMDAYDNVLVSQAIKLMGQKEAEKALPLLKKTFNKTALIQDKIHECKLMIYVKAEKAVKRKSYLEARDLFTLLEDFNDANERAKECTEKAYRQAREDYASGHLMSAKPKFQRLGNYKDAAIFAKECEGRRRRAAYNAKDDIDTKVRAASALKKTKHDHKPHSKTGIGCWFAAILLSIMPFVLYFSLFKDYVIPADGYDALNVFRFLFSGFLLGLICALALPLITLNMSNAFRFARRPYLYFILAFIDMIVALSLENTWGWGYVWGVYAFMATLLFAIAYLATKNRNAYRSPALASAYVMFSWFICLNHFVYANWLAHLLFMLLSSFVICSYFYVILRRWVRKNHVNNV